MFFKEAYNQNLWNFELGSQESMKVPIGKIIGFQQRDRKESQNLSNDTFCRLLVTAAQCIIGTEKHPHGGILLSYVDVEYSQGYGQIKEAFKGQQKMTSFNHIYLLIY